MECLTLPKADEPEPSLSVNAFSQRCKTLAVKFADVINVATGDLAFIPSVSGTGAVMTLGGRVSETIARNRGQSHPVVPVTPLRNDVWIWTGYREAWLRHGKEQNFRFVEAGFTLHIGRLGEIHKPQLLRSEWVGKRSRAFVELAGHPHWQLDVLETARAVSQPAGITRFGAPPAAVVLEFDRNEVLPDIKDLLLGLTIEDMHFASAALWWRSSGAYVAHLPESVGDLDRWVLGCIGYLRQEAARCRFPVAAA